MICPGCLAALPTAASNSGLLGDGLHPGPGLGGPTVPTPPVVDQSHSASTGLAAFHVLGRKATLTPLVLQLIEAVLRIRPVAVQLGHGIQSIATVGHKC